MNTKKRIIIVSLFSGMDLLMLSFLRAFALPGYGLEKNIWAALMHAKNLTYGDGTPVMQFVSITKEEHQMLKANKDNEFDSALIDGQYIRGKRIEEVNGAEIRAELERRFGKDICIICCGGPPCQDLISMNHKKREGSRNRSNLIFQYLRVLNELNPAVAIMEEAEELHQKVHEELFNKFLNEAKKLPFKIAHGVFNSSHYGSKQQRIRTIVMMVNKSLCKMPVFPEPDLVNVKRVRDFLDIQYFHSGSYIDKIKNSGHFMCSVTSGAPAYFIERGIKRDPTTDELLSCFDLNPGEYKIPSIIPKLQVRKAIANAVSVALFHKIANTIIEKILCLKHVGDNWFEPIEGTDDTSGLPQYNNAPESPTPVCNEQTSPADTTKEPACIEPSVSGAATQLQTTDETIPSDSGELNDASGYVLYHGPSAINGANIVAIITVNSVNEKTGPMSQLWILPADTPPLQAITTGEDEAVCGQCRLRHYLKGACYVTVAKGPAIVYKAWKNGNYPYLPLEEYSRFIGKAIRLGAYGDPAVIDFNVLEELKKYASTTTCYTHQWANENAGALKALSMASVDNIEEYHKATALGWRTFRIIEADESPSEGEILCPNTTKGVQCIDCGLCAGNSIQAKNIAIPLHGTHTLKFNTNLGYATWAIKNRPHGAPVSPVDAEVDSFKQPVDILAGAVVKPTLLLPIKASEQGTAINKPAERGIIPPPIVNNVPPENKPSHNIFNNPAPHPGSTTKTIRPGRIITSQDLIGMQFTELNFTGKWKIFLGSPSNNFYCIVHGIAGEGKSTLGIQFADYLANEFGKVLYISGEEGISKTFRDKFILTNSVSPLLHVVELKSFQDIIRVVQPDVYSFIFIDSLQHLKIDAVKMRELRIRYKNSAFISVSQSTKDGSMRGSAEHAHDADIVIEVVKGLATTTKNRFKEKGATFNVFEVLTEGEDPIDSVVATKEIIDAPPAGNDAPNSMEELELLLNEALEKEDFEAAAKFRDRISKMKNN